MALHKFGHHSITKHFSDLSILKSELNDLKNTINETVTSKKPNLYGYFFITLKATKNYHEQRKNHIFYELENNVGHTYYKYELSEPSEIISIKSSSVNVDLCINEKDMYRNTSLTNKKVYLKANDTLSIHSVTVERLPSIYVLIKYSIQE